jgi:hypothetical protein
MDYIPPLRSEKTLEFYQNALLLNLLHLFKTRFPGEGRQQFFDTILLPLRDLRISGDKKLEEAYTLPSIGKYQLFIIACAYWIEMDRALREGRREDAWSFCMDASYYLGGANASSQTVEENPVEIVHALEQARSELGKNAARAKHLPWENVRAEAVRLAAERGAAGKTWASYSQMAKDIKEEVLKYAGKQGLRMSVERAPATITSYLKSEDRLQAFIRKKNTTATGTR